MNTGKTGTRGMAECLPELTLGKGHPIPIIRPGNNGPLMADEPTPSLITNKPGQWSQGAGWMCVRCRRRTTVIAGRKLSLAPKGWICKACQK